MRIWKSILALAATITLSTPAFAWDPQGHKLVGSIADELLNPNARQQVAQILGYSLQVAAPWPDCVRSIVRQDKARLTHMITCPLRFIPSIGPLARRSRQMPNSKGCKIMPSETGSIAPISRVR